MSDFRLLLLEISNEITNADLAKLKFLCEDVIPSRTAEGISQPFELFSALEQRNLLSEQNREFLASKLSDVNRIALRNKLLGIQGKRVLKKMYIFVLFFIMSSFFCIKLQTCFVHIHIVFVVSGLLTIHVANTNLA